MFTGVRQFKPPPGKIHSHALYCWPDQDRPAPPQVAQDLLVLGLPETGSGVGMRCCWSLTMKS